MGAFQDVYKRQGSDSSNNDSNNGSNGYNQGNGNSGNGSNGYDNNGNSGSDNGSDSGDAVSYTHLKNNYNEIILPDTNKNFVVKNNVLYDKGCLLYTSRCV